MKALIWEAARTMSMREEKRPEAPADEILVKVDYVGICGSELSGYLGHNALRVPPLIMGHEFAGEIVAVGPMVATLRPDLTVGALVTVNPLWYCGECRQCVAGFTQLCGNRRLLGAHRPGAVAEYISVPAKLALTLPEGMDSRIGALTEPVGCALRIAELAGDVRGSDCLIIGAGPIGLATAQFAKLAGAEVMVMEVNEKRLDFCQDVLGIDTLIDARGDAMGQVEKALGGELPTLVFDCTGSAKSMHAAFDYVAHGGALALVGHITGDITFSDPHFHSHELTLLASRNATPADFAWVIECLRAGQINLAPWVTHEATPEGILREFPRWVDPATGVIKAMLRFD